MKRAYELRKDARGALKNCYWSFLGLLFVQGLAVIGLIIIPTIMLIIGGVLIGEDAINELVVSVQLFDMPDIASSAYLYMLLALAGLIGLIMVIFYTIGFVKWGVSKASLEAMRGNMKFGLWDSGYGHGWHMFWIQSVKQCYIFFWSLLFIIPGIMKSFSYALTDFVAIDHPDWCASQCITESRRLMAGNRFRLFCLVLSFFWWYVLVLVICAITQTAFADIFLRPYMSTAFAAFYENLVSEKS